MITESTTYSCTHVISMQPPFPQHIQDTQLSVFQYHVIDHISKGSVLLHSKRQAEGCQ